MKRPRQQMLLPTFVVQRTRASSQPCGFAEVYLSGCLFLGKSGFFADAFLFTLLLDCTISAFI